MHCGGTVEPWKRTHVHQPRDFISHWKSTANAARGGGQSLAAFRCVRMWNAKCERAAQPEQQQARASLRCAALPCVALRCNLLCRRRRRRLLKCPPPTTTTTTRQIAENCQRQWFSSIAFIVLECERERKGDVLHERLWVEECVHVCVNGRVCVWVWVGLCCLILFSLSIALHACKYAIRTHTHESIHMYWKDRQHQHIRPNWFLC